MKAQKEHIFLGGGGEGCDGGVAARKKEVK